MLSEILTSVALGLSLVAFLTLRLYPLWPNRDRGCDAYYFLICARALRISWRLPILLSSKYLAEPQEQWYPPLFPVFLSLLPAEWLHRRHWAVNHLLDLATALAIFLLTHPFVGSPGATVAVIIYAMQPALVHEFATLTSRPLGMLLQMLAIGAGYIYVSDGLVSAAVLAAVSIAILVYTHKLSLQLLWFLLPFLAVTTMDWRWLALLVAGYILAAAIWPSFFLRIQRAHLDIVSFWSRNWPLLGAHPVRQSPLYGNALQPSTAYYSSKIARSPVLFLKTVLQLNIFAIFLPMGLFFPLEEAPLSDVLFWWVAGIYSWVAITHLVPQARCLGLAQQYVKFAYLPTLGFSAIYVSETGSVWVFLLAAVCSALLLRWYLLTVREMHRLPVPAQSNDVDALLTFVDQQTAPRIMIFPYHLADELAYRSKAQVVWGTHGYGFDQVGSFFPVLRSSLSAILDEFRVSHLVIDTNYVAPEELTLESDHANVAIERFLIYEINGSNIVGTGAMRANSRQA